MKVALVMILLALVVIPDSEGWRRRFRFRFRAPRIRFRKVIKKVFRPVIKVIKPVVRKVIKPILKKVEEKVVKPALDKVIKPVLKTAVQIALTHPLLKPIQKKVCGSPEEKREEFPESQRDLNVRLSEFGNIEDQLQDAGDALEQRDVQAGDFTVRDERQVEDELEKYVLEGRGMEGLESVVRDVRDVREIHHLLTDPVRSKRLKKTLGEVLCGPVPGGEEGPEQEEEPEVEEIVTVPITEIVYVTAAPEQAPATS